MTTARTPSALPAYRLVGGSEAVEFSNGTYLYSEFLLSPRKLLAALGEPPVDQGDSCKVTKYWVFERNGKIFTVYDWKATDRYDDDAPTPTAFWEQKYEAEFSVGSKEPATKEDVDVFVKELLAVCNGRTAPRHTPFDAYEVHGVREYTENGEMWCEQVDDNDANFWSVYGHIPGHGLLCIGDFTTRADAEEIMARITGCR